MSKGYRIPKIDGGVGLGSMVPLKNVSIIAAPKNVEAKIRGWMTANCPQAKFISYEAAALLESDDLYGLVPLVKPNQTPPANWQWHEDHPSRLSDNPYLISFDSSDDEL